MPQVLVGNGDSVEIRYPTPSTWNTKTTVQVQIGTGLDPTDVTFGTRIPAAKPDNFVFADQQASLTPGGSLISPLEESDGFERNTVYYSNQIVISGIEVEVPAVLSVSTQGPKTLTANTVEAAFEINSSGNWIAPGTTVQVKNDDVIRLRVKTEDWYTMTTNITLTVSDETWGTEIGEDPTTSSDTWSITTRSQDTQIPQYAFVDFVDVKFTEFGSYKTDSIDIEDIDADAVLRATCTEEGEISLDGLNWSQSITGIVLGDTLYTRILIGNFTEQTTSDFKVYAVSGDTYTRNGINYENNSSGTYGPTEAQVVQLLSDVKDDWNVWTEVDRYPEPFTLSPIYVKSDGDDVVVSSTSTYNTAEVGFTYYCDFDIAGLGVEYTSGAYLDLNSPYDLEGNGIPPFDTSSVDGRDVELRCRVAQGQARIRKNNDGEWVQELFVKNGDQVNVKFPADLIYNSLLESKIVLDGPPEGGPSPYLNPTGGPSPATQPNKEDTIKIKTRQSRTQPYQFKAKNEWFVDRGKVVESLIDIGGFDQKISSTIVTATPGSNAQMSADGINYYSQGLSNIAPSENTTIRLRASASSNWNSLVEVEYEVSSTEDTYVIETKKEGYEYSTFNFLGTEQIYTVPNWAETLDFVLIGAGGGDGGNDAPNSYGGRGARGNIIRGTIAFPKEFFDDPKIKIFVPESGKNGTNFSTAAPGGAGGWGYATGGNGGSSGIGDKSGGGGGGGGAAAITLMDGTVLAIAGGGAGGGGAGNDTVVQKDWQNGNNDGFGELESGTTASGTPGLFLIGLDGEDNPSQGGGGGGAGGGYGTNGVIVTSKLDESNVEVQTDDLDATGGSGGGAYFNSDYVTLATKYNFGDIGAPPKNNGLIAVGYPPQDKTPDDFSFTSFDGADINSEIVSERVQITGITGNVEVSANEFSATVRVCELDNDETCSEWGSPQLIRNGEYLQIKATTEDQYFTTYQVKVKVGDTIKYWTIYTGEPPDTIPNPYTIPPNVDEAVSIPGSPNLVESDAVSITGINQPVQITASGGAEISICTISNGEPLCDDYQLGPRTISNGQLFKLRIATSEQYDSTISSTVTVGTGATAIETWEVTTEKEPDTNPLSFTFFDLVDQPLETKVFSKNTVTVQGIDIPVAFSVTRVDGNLTANQVSIILNGNDTGSNTANVVNFDTIKLAYTTSNILGESVQFYYKAGSSTQKIWTVTNFGDDNTTPDPFNLITKIVDPLEYGFSDPVVISGLGANTSVSVFTTNGAFIRITSTDPGRDTGGAFLPATFSSPKTIANGDTLEVRLLSSLIGGFEVNTIVYVGGYNTTWSVKTSVGEGEIVKGQWYSSIQPIKIDDNGGQIRYSTKFEGLPVGSMIPIFQDATEDDSWGKLDGLPDSRFHGWIYCDGSYVSPDDFPLLYDVFTSGGLTSPVYGENGAGDFRLPDFRNKKVLGTGPIDGNAPSSPVVAPYFGPAKNKLGLKGSDVPGSHGGMWYIDKVGDPGINDTEGDYEFEQVYDGGSSLPDQESPYFSIANIRTTGYETISGQIEFEPTGEIKGNVSLGQTKIFEAPLHQHTLITGQPDPTRTNGIVYWNGEGGQRNDYKVESRFGDVAPASESYIVNINLWGYGAGDYTLSNDDTIRINPVPKNDNSVWLKKVESWSGPSGYVGERVTSDWGDINIKQNTSFISEIGEYIDINLDFGGNVESGNDVRYIGTVDIPEKQITIKAYSPANKAKHTHYLSLSQPSSGTYSYGKDDSAGVDPGGSYSQTEEITFSAFDVGVEVLPGTFTLSANKQLIPTPSFVPQDIVPLITPYTWIKWIIKAF